MTLGITETGLLSAILLGLGIGFFYLWSSTTRIAFPAVLLVIGMAFFVALGVGSYLGGDAERAWTSAGRALLWVVFCLGLHVGNIARFYVQKAWLGRKIRRITSSRSRRA